MFQQLDREATQGSFRHVFAVYAAVTLVPVLLLGVVLVFVGGTQGHARGLAEARSKAQLIGRTVISPELSGHDLTAGLTGGERSALALSVTQAIKDSEVSRLRVRNLAGSVIFAADVAGTGRGLGEAADDEVLAAARGRTISRLTWLNADNHDSGPRGPRVVEIYQPLTSIQSGQRIGVLEMYLPYAPIAADISEGRWVLVITLSAGLILTWLFLLLVSASVARRLRRQASENSYLASHDPLTGMPNRALFSDCVALAIPASTDLRPSAVALIDLDRFKEINDTLGHENGDQLLAILAQRLNTYVRDGDTIARLGGDEFGVVLNGVRSAGETVEVLSRLRNLISEPVHIEGLPLAVECSIGFVLAPQDGIEVGQLLQRADVAMYVAKREHLGIVHYRPEQDHYDSSTLTLVAELATAIVEDQLVLHYQPKADLVDGTIGTVEALLRWEHPTRGLLYPDVFLPAAEQTELIDELTRWVLRRACSSLPEFDPQGKLSVAVNISARNLSRSDFAEDVLAILRQQGTDPRRIILEITETALMADPARATRTLNQLHASGVRISIDDFGAGQTSLGYLATLPISELKIDKTFVLSMMSDERNSAIVRSVIELGHSLGFTVTAEGVETTEALRHLAAYHCDTVQGYLLARPSVAADLQSKLATARAVLAGSHEAG